MAGFGRKGLTADTAPAARSAGFGNSSARLTQPKPANAGGSEIDRKREAFIQAERARRANESDADEVEAEYSAREEAGVSSYAQSFQSSRPVNYKKKLSMAYFFWFVLGNVSAHRFYLGATRSAWIQLGMFAASLVLMFLGSDANSTTVATIGMITFGLWTLWIFADAFLIHKIHRKFRQGLELSGIFA